MKLHIEVLQEKVESVTKERDMAKKDHDLATEESMGEIDKLNKILKTLQEELTSKVDRIKRQDTILQESKEECYSLLSRLQQV